MSIREGEEVEGKMKTNSLILLAKTTLRIYSK
jgi:hypothetical protein